MIPAQDPMMGVVPDPQTVGPSFIQIGTEGGFLPAPAVINSTPITWITDPNNPNFGNVDKHALLLGSAERADVIIDFSQYKGQTLILYNDAPAGFPAPDSRYDFYTNDTEQTGIGGAPTTQKGYGPNTRTIMQIKVSNSPASAPYNLTVLNETFAKTATKRGVFEAGQDPVIVPMPGYETAYNSPSLTSPWATVKFLDLQDALRENSDDPTATEGYPGHDALCVRPRLRAHDRFTGARTARGSTYKNYTLYPYTSPPVEILNDSRVIGEPLAVASDGTQIWRIMHNGGDTHPVHFHLFNVQLINRLCHGWHDIAS